MNKVLAVFLGLLLAGVLCLAQAQVPMTGAGKGTPTTVAYVGPGDLVAANNWWGLRGYSAAYSTGSNSAIDICDTATGLTCTTGIKILSNGKLDTVTAAAAPACAVSCSVTKLYGQVGGKDLVYDGTIGHAPVLTFNCINTTLPCMTFNGTSQFLSNASIVLTGPNSLMTVANATNNGDYQKFIDSDGAGSDVPVIYYNISGDAAAATCDNGDFPIGTATSGTWNILQLACSDAFYINNVSAGAAGGNGDTTGIFAIGFHSTGDQYLNGKETEVGLWNLAWNSTQRGNLCHNSFAYWATATSC